MPYDPAWPQNGQNIDADRFREQFGALNDKIDAVPAGPPGPEGPPGADGPPGGDGAPGQPFAQAVVDAVNTLPPGSEATVDVGFDGTNVHFTFGLTQGADGTPGEVSNEALDAAIAGTSANTNAVATLDDPFANDPLSLAEGEVLRAKVNELIGALRR